MTFQMLDFCYKTVFPLTTSKTTVEMYAEKGLFFLQSNFKCTQIVEIYSRYEFKY